LLKKLHVHNNWISEWFTIKTVVRNVDRYFFEIQQWNVDRHFLKYSNGKYMVVGIFNKQFKTLIKMIILKLSSTFCCTGTTGSLKINHLYVMGI